MTAMEEFIEKIEATIFDNGGMPLSADQMAYNDGIYTSVVFAKELLEKEEQQHESTWKESSNYTSSLTFEQYYNELKND